MPKVTVYTQVYNAGAWLEQCVSSVLSQTYTDFEYLLVDSASTDGSAEKIKAYAEQDARIKAILLTENDPNIRFEITKQYATGEYFATVDHDDWIEPNFLERLVSFADGKSLDLAITGVVQYFEESHVSRVMRKLNTPIVVTPQQFAQAYAQIGVFAGAWWASLMRLELYLSLESEVMEIWNLGLVWRSDTMSMLKCIEHCSRLGIDSSALQHYRMHNNSLIQRYNERYFDSCVIFCDTLEKFLQKYGVQGPLTQEYLKKRFLFELASPLTALNNSSLPDGEKIRICAQIAEHPRTGHALSLDCTERANFYKFITKIVVKAIRAEQITSNDVKAVRSILRLVAPDCIGVITESSIAVFAKEPLLLRALLCNDTTDLVRRILQLIEHNQYEGLGEMLHGLIPDGSPLQLVADTRFYEHYTDISRSILQGKYMAALDQMTEFLMTGNPLLDEEIFLHIYLTLAAIERQISAFLYGKIQLAKFYLKADQQGDCREILFELEEMGAGEHAEVVELRQRLQEMGGMNQ